jgi:hypothetical protein
VTRTTGIDPCNRLRASPIAPEENDLKHYGSSRQDRTSGKEQRMDIETKSM